MKTNMQAIKDINFHMCLGLLVIGFCFFALIAAELTFFVTIFDKYFHYMSTQYASINSPSIALKGDIGGVMLNTCSQVLN